VYRIYVAGSVFNCECRLQDGTERWTETTLETAIRSVKKFAKVMNGTKIKKKDITFLKPQEKIETVWILFHPGKK
jgi:hypothetical protein